MNLKRLASLAAAGFVAVFLFAVCPKQTPPDPPVGAPSGMKGVPYACSTQVTSADGEDVAYQFDWGDAPDPTYPTLGSSTGANHLIVPGVFMGTSIDSELGHCAGSSSQARRSASTAPIPLGPSWKPRSRADCR